MARRKKPEKATQNLGIYAIKGILRGVGRVGESREEFSRQITADLLAGMDWKRIAIKYGYSVSGVKAIYYDNLCRKSVTTDTPD